MYLGIEMLCLYISHQKPISKEEKYLYIYKNADWNLYKNGLKIIFFYTA